MTTLSLLVVLCSLWLKSVSKVDGRRVQNMILFFFFKGGILV